MCWNAPSVRGTNQIGAHRPQMVGPRTGLERTGQQTPGLPGHQAALEDDCSMCTADRWR